MIKEASIEDLNMIFKDSLIRHKGIPVIVKSINRAERNILKAEYFNIVTLDYYWDTFNEEDCDFKPVRLGYVNHRGFALYIFRRPVRRFKQGLSSENMGYVRTDAKMNLDRDGLLRFRSASEDVMGLQAKGIYNTINNVYPSLKDAISMFEDQAYEVAFDRQFSIFRDMSILYKGKLVGVYDTYHDLIKFKPGFEYLEKALRKGYNEAV